jgi:transcription antitermination factor NusG
MSYWAIAQVQPQRLAITGTLLDRAGYEIYAPRVRTRRQAAAPGGLSSLLFPGYVFVHITDGRFYAVRYTPGVVRLLMAGECPARMPEREIEDLRRREVKGYIWLPPRVPRIGAKVRIISGPFAGHLALFEGMAGADRLRVLFDFLGGVVRIELPGHAVEPQDVAINRGLRY